MKYRHRVLLLLCSLSIITYLDRICIAVAGPRMQADLGISPAMWGWIGSAFTLSYGAFEIPTGHWGDRVGPRKVLTRVMLWWSSFTALTGFASQASVLLLIRFCFGAGEAGAYPNSAIAIAGWFPKSEQSRALGWTVMCSQLGGALTPFLVVPIQARFGWRAAFLFFGFLGIPWAAAWYHWFRNTPHEGADIRRAELEGVEAVHASRPATSWRPILISWNLWKVVLVAASFGYGMYFYAFWLHTYLVKARGFSERGLLFSTGPFLLGAVTNVLGGHVSDLLARRVGIAWSRRIVGVIGLGSAAFFTVGAILSSNGYSSLLCLAIAYAGMTFEQPNVWAVCVDIGKDRAGAVSGFMNTGWNAGAFLSSLVFGYLVQFTGSYNPALFAIAGVLAAGAFLWLRIDPSAELRGSTHS